MDIVEALEKCGYAASVVSIERLPDLREGIEGQHRQGILDEGLYDEYLKGFVFHPPESMLNARSIISVAVKQPQVRFVFGHKGTKVPVIVPPTYLHAARADHAIREILVEMLAPYRVAPAVLPKKLLAVRSGLAAYGRNNITYVEGKGSFHRLAAFYSDMPCEKGDDWHELTMMEECRDCDACTVQCPAGAISGERFLIHAERCIVFHNEKPGNMPFPKWMDASWHNCLVGCLHCQQYCPVNNGMLETVDGAEFTQDETGLLMAGTTKDMLPAPLIKKLEEWDLLASLDIIPRNLSALFS